MKKSAGSYDFGTFEEAELERLKQQALVAIQIEKLLWEQAGLSKGMKVLDLACGPGIISCELAKVVSPGDVVGVDLSDELINIAKAYKKYEGIQNVSFMTENV